MKQAIEINEANFENEVLQSNQPVLVDFWAEWCGPCKQIGPLLEELAGEYKGKFAIGKVNVDEEQDLAAKYRVSSIPMLLILKNGQVIDQWVGSGKTKKALIEKFEAAIKA